MGLKWKEVTGVSSNYSHVCFIYAYRRPEKVMKQRMFHLQPLRKSKTRKLCCAVFLGVLTKEILWGLWWWCKFCVFSVTKSLWSIINSRTTWSAVQTDAEVSKNDVSLSFSFKKVTETDVEASWRRPLYKHIIWLNRTTTDPPAKLIMENLDAALTVTLLTQNWHSFLKYVCCMSITMLQACTLSAVWLPNFNNKFIYFSRRETQFSAHAHNFLQANPPVSFNLDDKCDAKSIWWIFFKMLSESSELWWTLNSTKSSEEKRDKLYIDQLVMWHLGFYIENTNNQWRFTRSEQLLIDVVVLINHTRALVENYSLHSFTSPSSGCISGY